MQQRHLQGRGRKEVNKKQLQIVVDVKRKNWKWKNHRNKS